MLSFFRPTVPQKLNLTTISLFKFVLLVLCLTFGHAPLFGQFQLTKSVDSTTINAGRSFGYTLKYSCTNVAGNCSNIVVTDTIPAGLIVESTVGTVHTINNGTVSGNRVTFTFIDPMPAGSTGDLRIMVRFPNGSTPDGTMVTNTGYITDGVTKLASNTVSTTAIAQNRFKAIKTLASGGALDAPFIYKIEIRADDAYVAAFGTLNPTNITISDQLPAGATVLSISDGGTDNGSGLITWSVPDAPLAVTPSNNTNSLFRTVTVQYNSPTFALNDMVTNTASVTYTPLGQTPITTVNGDIIDNMVTDLEEKTTLVAPTFNHTVLKEAGVSTIGAGQSNYYALNWSNTGNVQLQNFYVEDSIPAEIIITSFYTGGWTNIDPSTYNIYYKTNLNSTYILWSGSPVLIPTYFTTASLGLALGEQLTYIKFDFGDFPAGATLAGGTALYLQYTAADVATVTPTTNKLAVTTTSPTIGPITRQASVTINPRPPFAIPQPSKAFYTTPGLGQYLYSAPRSIGDTVWVGLQMHVNGGGQPMQNPILADLLPDGLVYDNAWRTVADSLYLGMPTFTLTPNYNGTDRQLLEFSWTGTAPLDKDAYVFFRAKVTNLANAPYEVNQVALYGTNGNGCIDNDIYNQFDGFLRDSLDINKNGSATDSICLARAQITISPSASLESLKLVKGLLDSVYTKQPLSGLTVPGGPADYQLYIKNTGNVPMKDIEIIDILPFIGDMGVIDTTTRLTEWRPNLAAPIDAPAGVTVYYSQSSNPCRPSLVPAGPVGCEAPNWSTTPPSDITTVQSLRFDFGAIVIQPGQQLDFNWPMRAPVNAPTSGEIAWNSFGYVATRTDNNSVLLAAEPNKVGIAVQPPSLALYGNQVWLDNNQNGIRDEVNTGVNGVVVKLFRDNGDNINDPANDTLVSFAVTGNGGLYQFPNLLAGDYYAVFYPPMSFTSTLPNAPTDLTDSLDSDGVPGTYLGDPVAITAITQLAANEFDFTWDFGIYCSEPQYTASLVDATCAGGTGSIHFTSTTGDKYGISSGSTYAGPAYETATTITTPAMQSVLSGLPNPTSDSLFTLRLFNGLNGCYKDTTLTLKVISCGCSIAFAANPVVSPCNAADNTYTLAVQVTYAAAPTGNITINGQTFTPNGSGSETFTLTGLVSNGFMAVPVNGHFVSQPSCASNTITYNAPLSCRPLCPMPNCGTATIMKN
jgi:large repetitive protein